MDFSGKKIMIGLSGGINSMAVLCWLGELPKSKRPPKLHLFYADFKEHSPDTTQFVLDGQFWARGRFENVVYKQTNNSVMEYFENEGIIPHPKLSPCSQSLKILPMLKYAYAEAIQIDLIGYVSKEVKRANRAIKNGNNDMFFQKDFPILGKDDEWCFEIVDRCIGWHPAIYDIRDEKGRRVFTHNNCLPCKNMTPKQFQSVATYFPAYHQRALEAERNTGSYFGRSKFDTQCAICDFD